MTASRRVRLFALAAACAALVAVVLFWVNATSEPRSAVVADSPASSSSAPVRAGWKTVEYKGIQINIPTAWVRADMSDCEFRFELWASPESEPCGTEGGVAFYVSATFDPFHGPGVWRTATKGTNAAAWNGYVHAGDYAVYAADDDRDLVQGVLDSARLVRK